MKNTITIALEPEKLSALTMYMEQKGSSLKDEFVKYVEQLYQKNVPQNVRDFIDMMAKEQPTAKAKRAARIAANTHSKE